MPTRNSRGGRAGLGGRCPPPAQTSRRWRAAAAASGPETAAIVTVASPAVVVAPIRNPSAWLCGGSEAAIGGAGPRGCRRPPARVEDQTHSVDEQQVEPVAHAEAVEAGVDERLAAFAGSAAAVEVEHAAAVGVGEGALRRAGRPRRRGWRVLSPLPRRMTSGMRPGCEQRGPRAESRPRVPDELQRRRGRGRPRRAAGASDGVHEGDGGGEGGGAGPQHARVLRLHQLRRDVDGDVGAGLVVGADDTDGAAPLLQDEVPVEGADGALGRLSLDVGEDVELAAIASSRASSSLSRSSRPPLMPSATAWPGPRGSRRGSRRGR